jgi:hypothetical protein
MKNVIAGQPIIRGGSHCTNACDIENHHTHTYCKACKRNLPYGTIVHNCIIGFELGKTRPGMDPAYLVLYNEIYQLIVYNIIKEFD